MQAAPSTSDLGTRLTAAWNGCEKPKPVIKLVPLGSDPGMQLRSVAEELAIQFIPIRLQQVVTPEQHGHFTQDKPRLVAVYGIDRLTLGEREAFARLLRNGPKTLIVMICPVEAEQAERVSAAWARLRCLEADQLLRKERLSKLTTPAVPVPNAGSPW